MFISVKYDFNSKHLDSVTSWLRHAVVETENIRFFDKILPILK